MVLTREEIEKHRTQNGGFTRATLAAWGISWPPARGWKYKLITGRDQTEFTKSAAWLKLRYEVMQRDGFRCTICGRDASDRVRLQVEHIKPRSLYPELELDKDNLRTACSDCNQGKGDRCI